jgi:hypothetical protein
VHLPTLGSGVNRTVRLFGRSGEFLDASGDRFPVIQSVSIALSIVDAQSSPLVTTVGTEAPVPELVLMSEAVKRVESQYAESRVSGAETILLDENADVHKEIKNRLKGSRGTVRILDRYFGKNPLDWSMLPANTDVEVLITNNGVPPEPLRSNETRGRI